MIRGIALIRCSSNNSFNNQGNQNNPDDHNNTVSYEEINARLDVLFIYYKSLKMKNDKLLLLEKIDHQSLLNSETINTNLAIITSCKEMLDQSQKQNYNQIWEDCLKNSGLIFFDWMIILERMCININYRNNIVQFKRKMYSEDNLNQLIQFCEDQVKYLNLLSKTPEIKQEDKDSIEKLQEEHQNNIKKLQEQLQKELQEQSKSEKDTDIQKQDK